MRDSNTRYTFLPGKSMLVSYQRDAVPYHPEKEQALPLNDFIRYGACGTLGHSPHRNIEIIAAQKKSERSFRT